MGVIRHTNTCWGDSGMVGHPAFCQDRQRGHCGCASDDDHSPDFNQVSRVLPCTPSAGSLGPKAAHLHRGCQDCGVFGCCGPGCVSNMAVCTGEGTSETVTHSLLPIGGRKAHHPAPTQTGPSLVCALGFVCLQLSRTPKTRCRANQHGCCLVYLRQPGPL